MLESSSTALGIGTITTISSATSVAASSTILVVCLSPVSPLTQ
jgi:hypothetical protein